MKNLLFIGDSITKGSTGVSYVNLIRKKMPGVHITEKGVEGETLNRIAFRLLQQLDKKEGYDTIIIQAGYNDIMLPAFQGKGTGFQFAFRKQIEKGMHPFMTSEAFEQFYKETLEKVRNTFSGNIILVTIGLINENQNSELNIQRHAFNQAIKRVAGQYVCRVADTGESCTKALTGHAQQNYFLKHFLNAAVLDKLYCLFPGGADRLSRKRGLLLTIDGVHLNTAGAGIFSNTILETLTHFH